MTNATEVVDETGIAGAKEAFELALAGAEAQYYDEKTKGNTNVTSSEYITIVMIREGLGNSYQYCSADSSAENTADDNKTLDEIYNSNGGIIYLSKKGSTGSGTIYKITFDVVDGDVTNIAVSVVETISTEESYIGAYADVDGDGNVDGVIYADLAHSASDYWGSSSYKYSYSAIDSSELREYEITQNSYTDTYFGTNVVISPVEGTSGEQRFYILELSNHTISSYSTFPWYYNAYGNISSSIASTSFGKGLSNTTAVKAIWDAGTYTTRSGDMWVIDDIGTSIGDTDSTWYVPSQEEWTAFASTYEITASNYSSTYGLNGGYWSSSLYSSTNAWLANFRNATMAHDKMSSNNYVRLGSTF